MARAPFSLFTKSNKSGKVWYARFYNLETGKYDTTKSTGVKCVGKKGRKMEAYEWARNHIPNSEESSPKLIPFLENFWSANSEYIRSKKVVEKKEFAGYYISSNANGIRLHVKTYPPFKNIQLNKLRPGMIEDWKLWTLEKGLGVRRVNAVLQAMRTAVRYAVFRGDLSIDPFGAVKKVPYKPKDKGILDINEAKKIIQVEDPNPRAYLAVLLALLTGMRRGEVRGLLWGDIDNKNGIINVQHNYIDGDGLKGCKWGSERKVPLHPALLTALAAVKNMSEFTSSSDFVMFNLQEKDSPCSVAGIRSGFKRMLLKIGIDEDARKLRNLTFHSLRHTFVTIARLSGLPDITVQALAGHKTSQMMELYSHAEKVIDFKQVIDRIVTNL
jgi:integrase